MNRNRVWLVAAGLTAAVMVLSARGDTPDSYSQIKAARARRLELAQRGASREHRLTLLNPRSVIAADTRARAGDFSSRAVGRQWVRPADVAGLATAPPPPSPGLALGNSPWDAQHDYSSGYQTARLAGDPCVHFCWTAWDRLSMSDFDNDRYVAYNSYSIDLGVLNQGYGGVFIGLDNQARAAYTNLDVDAGNLAHIALHQRQDPAFPYHCWRIFMPIACNALHVDDELSGTGSRCTQTLWPRIAAARDANPADSVIIHEIGIEDVNDCNNARIFYWRNTGGVWTGPSVIDSSEFSSYVIADDPNSNKVAVALQPIDGNTLVNVAYHESNTAGYGWLSGFELGPASRHYITNYTDLNGPQAWPELSTTYDNNGVLHIVYMEQKIADQSERIKILHWNSSRNTSRPVALSEYDGLNGTSAFNLNLSKVTVGIGDGSSMCSNGSGDELNNNYVYVSYIKFGGETPAEQADISASGYWNGELWLAVSNSGGYTWSPPVNLSNTKTPNCSPGLADTSTGIPANPDFVCRSEHWATIGRAVSDVDIFFISDLDAGAAVYGEGTWQQNPVHYLRLPAGTHAQYVCPVIAPVFEATLTAAQECEYHSTRTGTDVESMEIFNLGNATLSGVISVVDFPGAATLTLSGGVGAYSIPAGNPNIVKSVTMAANMVPEGLYQGSISITHNDATKTSPRVYPIDYFVVNAFFCPEDEVIKTGVASPGSLALQIESSGRFASQNDFGGLWRYSDTSSSIYDASLLVAHGTQGPDTTVYLHFGRRASNGQYGFRALTDLQIDTSAYGTNSGRATATAYMCTADSVVGIKMSWFFPQQNTKDEFVIVQYKLYRNRPTVPITGLAIGVLEDQDVVPASRLGTVQTGAENQAAGDAAKKLGYQIGVDTTNHVIVGNKTATRFRGGVAACGIWKGVHVGNNIDDIEPGGGPTDGFLYKQLTTLNGVDLFTDSTVDLYTLMALDAGKSIGAGETLTYTLVFASDTVSDASFKATVDAGLAEATSTGLCPNTCTCPCQYDPSCDGVISDSVDVSNTINRAFRGNPPTMDVGCPYERTDVDGSGASDVLDVTKVINVAVRGSSAGSQYDLNLCMPGDQLASLSGRSDQVTTAVAASPREGSAVLVEPQSVAPGQTGVAIGVYITNDISIVGFVLPLEFRTLTGGAYIAGPSGSFQRGLNPGKRMDTSPLGTSSHNPGTAGGWPAATVTDRTFAVANLAGSGCVRPIDPSGAWNTNSAAPDFVSPDAILLATISLGDPGIEEVIQLSPGADPPGLPSYLITCNIGPASGQFIIDTTCIRPANHLAMIDVNTNSFVPAFTAGIITVIGAGNQPPVLDHVGPRSVAIGQTLHITVTASDPDGTTPSLFAQGIPVNGSFVDHHDGTGAFQFVPASNQLGVHNVRFIASDGSLADSELAAITVTADSSMGLCISAQVNYGVGTSPYSVVSADLDGDGYRDLALANLDSRDVSVLRNNRDGSFGTAMSYAVGNSPVSVTARDLDGDNDADLVAANYGSHTVSVLKNIGDGTFAAAVNFPAGGHPQSVFAADLDGDHDADLAVADGDDSVSVLKNNGNGTFATAVSYTAGDGPQSIFVVDLDGDNDADLAVANVWSDNVSVLKNNGDGTFTAAVNYTVGDGPHSVSAADLDGDGDADVVVANAYSDNVSVLKNNGNGTFAMEVSYSVGDYPVSVSVADLNWDSNADLTTANRNGANVSVLNNIGDGTFAAAINYAAGSNPSSVSAADLDGDGDPDLAVGNSGSNNVSVLINCSLKPVCACDCHADPGNCDAVVDILDVVATINVAFRGAHSIIDPSEDCPYEATDTDCTGDTGVLDVVHMINVAFRGMNAGTQFCEPCP